ncbi:exo-beta 1,3 glucanase-like protein [Delitschia confertaspora ATCC 74209]|uniref:Exo-beta 1,3 glucanase-like protein n=1 Tax=Delitschia confertaspora ATCC 74209 TaxID=1513339 RepID=A0A9P4JKW0_9PLEO|nr:exo-beta 1,3 glucanase-like protein [Delitschia confertaspora ATCC 74209]
MSQDDPAYWLRDMPHFGLAAFNPNPPAYKVWRNIKDYGAKGDGVTDDTIAINAAIREGNRCGPRACQSSTTSPAVIYFPAGTYIVSSSIIPYYMTQLIGNPNSPAVLKATPGFEGLGVIDADPYPDERQAWASINIFFRQIRNINIDLTAILPEKPATGLHWPTGQATSLQNVKIIMTPSATSQQQGLFIENGSGGFISDIEVTGGLYGLNIGNQQFTMRNIKVSNAIVGISQIWNWGWLYQGLTLSDCNIAFSMINGLSVNQTVGSVVIVDSSVTNCPVFVDMAWTPTAAPAAAGQLILENIDLSNVPIAVRGSNQTVLPGGSSTIRAWGQGRRYIPNGPEVWQGSLNPASRSGGLLKDRSFYSKAKPQYETLGIDQFISVRSQGAKGDGITDDTTSIKNAIKSAASSRKILFFDHGVYKVTDTIYVPPGSRMVGETYSVIMAAGTVWADKTNPVPVVQIGKPDETGSLEWSDMVVSTQGSTPGAKLIEWNLAATPGSGMWDVHTRIGGFQGTNLQVAQCPIHAPVSNACMAAYMSLHITKSGSNAYLENTWFWTADHDLDDWNSTRISVYTGRGLLVEGSNVWLYGTGVEHHSLYQFQFSGAKNIVAGFIQTETPYWQPVPDAKSQPYPVNPAINDPDYTGLCSTTNCDALGLRVINSESVLIYGAGLYSFFNNYSTKCSDKPEEGGKEDCQSRIFSIEGDSSDIVVYGLNTIGSQSMVTVDGVDKAKWEDNVSVFPNTIAHFAHGM